MNPTDPGPVSRTRGSIFVVDDDDTIRALITMCLEHAGYDVTSGAGRTDVRSALVSRRFDLIIVDALMPDMDGVEVIREARLLQPNAAILGMSGGNPDVTSEFFRTLGHNLGTTHVLAKPFHLEQLITAVGQCLASERLTDRARSA